MRFQKSYLWLFLLAMFLAGLVGVGLVSSTSVPPAAARAARAMISPATSTVNVGEIITVEVYIENVGSLWAGQVSLGFDPAVVQVVDEAGSPATQIQRGDLLNPARVTEYVNAVDNTAGIIEYAATLRNDPRHPTSPASGSGGFARIFFKGVGAGSSAVAFSTEGTTYIHEIKFVDGDLNEFTLPLEDGSITVAAGIDVYLPLIRRSGVGQNTRATAPAIPVVAGEPATFEAVRELTRRSYGITAPLDVPEQLARGHAFDVAIGGGYAFWTNLLGEFCSPEGAVRAVNLTTLAVSTLYSSCDISPANVVADDTHVYYAEWGGDTIQRIPVGGGVPETVASARGLIFHRALALDSTHVYFGDEEGIKRAPKAGGAVDTLAAGYDSQKLAVDETHVYWTEGRVGGGAIRRVPKAGGAVETLLSDGGLDNPWGIAVDNTHVYWTELGTGKARRMPKAGGAVSDFVGADPLYMAQDIAVDGTDVYWLDTAAGPNGRLRKAPKGGGAVENLALGLFGPTGLNLTAANVFWGDDDGVWRLPIGASEVRVDLTIFDMEVTQGIQNLDPATADVPLVAEKTTFVRAYPTVNTADTPNVTAWLRGFRDGAELPGSPVSPIDPTVYVTNRGIYRPSLNDTINFWVPTSWRSGTVELRVEINPTGAIPESNTANNTFSETVTFHRRPPACPVMVPIRTHALRYDIHSSGFWDIIDLMRRLWPVPDVWVYYQSNDDAELQVCWWGPFPYPCDGPYELPDDDWKIIASLVLRDVFTDDPDECDDIDAQTHYVGMVHPDTNTGTLLGYATYDWASALFVKMLTDPDDSGGVSYFTPRGGAILAHEMAHNHDRRHVNCGGPDDIDTGYPYPPCQIDNVGPDRHYGFDAGTMSAIRPDEARDFMSYGGPQWVSDYTWEALFNRLAASSRREMAAAGTLTPDALTQAPEVLVVTGIITESTSTASLYDIYRLPQGEVGERKLRKLGERQLSMFRPEAAYRLELRDASGAVLASHPFDPPDANEGGDHRQFLLTVPFPGDAVEVLLFHNTELKDSEDVSPNPPQVQILAPNGGEVVTDELIIKWEAEDEDNDILKYTVQYSSDLGGTWQVVATNVPTTTLTISDTIGLPGSSQALMRVIANDGVNTGSDTSDEPFTVQPHAPIAHIDNPHDGAVFAPGTQIILMGGAIDAEDGTLPGDALQWFVNDDPLGFGKEVALSGLAPGTYIVTLRATDSGQMTGEDRITIHVQQLLCEAADQVDLVFLLDTSPDMDEHLDTACEIIPDVVSALQTQGLEVRHQVLGISQKRVCANASVRDEFPTSSVNHPADWGPAVMDVAGHYDWQDGATRLIVPITNQGPEDGDPVEDPGADRDAIDAAIAATQLNHVTAAPLLMPSPGVDVYFADTDESPGSVYHYDTATGTEDMLYTRPSRKLYSFTTFHLPDKLYYVNANEFKIYRTVSVGGAWGPEEVVYEHTTYVRDLAFVPEGDRLALYFSEASGAAANGKIYKLVDGKPVLYYEVKLEDVNGFWAGDFTFDDRMNLYLSSGNTVPASIYKVAGGRVEEIFRDEAEPIAGLTYLDGALYYANWRTTIYRLSLHSGERTVVYSNPQRTHLSDVGVVRRVQQAPPAALPLAEALATATGGRAFQWGDPDLDLASDLGRIIREVACAPVITGVSPVCGVDEETTLTLFGENLAVGTRLFVGGALAREVTPNEDGTRMTFKIPLGLETGRTYDLRVELPGIGSDTLSGGLTVGPCPDRCDGFMPGDIHPPMWDLWDGEMEFQALAASSNLTVRLYAHGGGMELSVEDIGGTPLGSTPVADGATGAMNVPTTAGNIYVIRVRAQQEEMAHFRLLSWGATWLRIPDDGDDWSGGVNPGPGEDHGAKSNPELGFDERWTEVGPQFATTTWYFNVLADTPRLAVRVWGEWPHGDGHAGMEWIDPNGVVIPLVGPEGPTFDHTWSVSNPTPGFWGLRIKADPPFSPWAQHYSLARVDDSDDDWLYFRRGSLAGPPCGPSVTLDPPEGPVCLDDIFRMDIVVSDVANLYGAEVHLTFDPAMLEVVDTAGNPAFEIVPGPFLDPAQGILGLNSADNVGGFIDYAVSLKDPAPPAFGTGVLATVYFRPKATGTTTVQFDQVKLSEKPVPPAPGKPIPAVFRDATFEVNECFAPGQETGTMSGQVWLDGRLNHSGAKVGAEPGGYLVLTLPDGSFQLAALPAGDYTVDVKKTSYLRAGERSFTVAGGGSLALPNVTLLGGDCNNDDTIDITDGAIASASFGFGTGQAGFDARADINGDGLVDIFDLVMVGNNFGCSVTDATARCRRWGRP